MLLFLLFYSFTSFIFSIYYPTCLPLRLSSPLTTSFTVRCPYPYHHLYAYIHTHSFTPLHSLPLLTRQLCHLTHLALRSLPLTLSSPSPSCLPSLHLSYTLTCSHYSSPLRSPLRSLPLTSTLAYPHLLPLTLTFTLATPHLSYLYAHSSLLYPHPYTHSYPHYPSSLRSLTGAVRLSFMLSFPYRYRSVPLNFTLTFTLTTRSVPLNFTLTPGQLYCHLLPLLVTLKLTTPYFTVTITATSSLYCLTLRGHLWSPLQSVDVTFTHTTRYHHRQLPSIAVCCTYLYRLFLSLTLIFTVGTPQFTHTLGAIPVTFTVTYAYA